MGKLPSNTDTHPHWLDLENYDQCSDMGLHGWYHALYERKSLLYLLKDFESRNLLEAEALAERIELESMLAALVADIGVIEIEENLPDFWRQPFAMDTTVDPLTVGGAGLLWSELMAREDLVRFEENLLSITSPRSFMIARQFWALERLAVDMLARVEGGGHFLAGSGRVHARIDLFAPEEKLLEDFTKFVREMKHALDIEARPEKKFGAKDFKKWHKHKVLPYLDLSFWYRIKGIKLTQHQMGMILFPNEYDVPLDDRVRRTVQPLADRLMSYAFMTALESQAEATPIEAA